MIGGMWSSSEFRPLSTAVPKSTWDLAEQGIKIGTGLLALFYAAGFLVVSIHHGQYGIVMFEFLRARVFAAGILFSLFLGVPVLSTWISILLSRRHKTTGKYQRWLIPIVFFSGVAYSWIFLVGPWMSGLYVRFDEFVRVWWFSPLKSPLPIFAGWFLGVSAVFWFFLLFKAW